MQSSPLLVAVQRHQQLMAAPQAKASSDLPHISAKSSNTNRGFLADSLCLLNRERYLLSSDKDHFKTPTVQKYNHVPYMALN